MINAAMVLIDTVYFEVGVCGIVWLLSGTVHRPIHFYYISLLLLYYIMDAKSTVLHHASWTPATCVVGTKRPRAHIRFLPLLCESAREWLPCDALIPQCAISAEQSVTIRVVGQRPIQIHVITVRLWHRIRLGYRQTTRRHKAKRCRC